MTVSLVGKGKISWLCRTVKVFFHIKQWSNAVLASFWGNSSTGISPCSIDFKHFFAVGFQLSTVRDWRLFCVVLFSYWKRREKVFGKWMNYFGYKQSECWTLLSFVAAKCAFCLTNWLHFCQVRPREIVVFIFFTFDCCFENSGHQVKKQTTNTDWNLVTILIIQRTREW